MGQNSRDLADEFAILCELIRRTGLMFCTIATIGSHEGR